MSLFKRKQVESFGEFYAGSSDGAQSMATAPDNPLSPNFVMLGDISKPKDLTRYLLACQTRYLGETISKTLSVGILLAHVKLLLKKYPPELIVRATLFAATISPRPFSWKFVEEKAIPEVLSRCQFLRTTAEKSPNMTKRRSARK